mgnify:CR=1 FL=1
MLLRLKTCNLLVENRVLRHSETYQFRADEFPQPIRNAYLHAVEIAKVHGLLPALYFMIHSLLGLRQSDYLPLWLNGCSQSLSPRRASLTTFTPGFSTGCYCSWASRRAFTTGLRTQCTKRLAKSRSNTYAKSVRVTRVLAGYATYYGKGYIYGVRKMMSIL